MAFRPSSDALRRPQRLGRNGHDGRKYVLDAMMEFADQQALQLLHRLAFSSMHARLLQKATQIQVLGLKT